MLRQPTIDFFSISFLLICIPDSSDVSMPSSFNKSKRFSELNFEFCDLVAIVILYLFELDKVIKYKQRERATTINQDHLMCNIMTNQLS